MPSAQEIYVESNGAGDAGRKLTKEGVPGIDVCPFAKVSAQQTTFERGFARIVRCQQRLVTVVPLRHEVDTALLHPAIEIARGDLIGIMEDGIVWRQDLHWLGFHADSFAAQLRWVG